MTKILGLLLFTILMMNSAMAKVYDHTEGNKLTLLEDPAASAEYKMELIRNAKHHINILTFFWDNSTIPERMAIELSKANARGVEVRILTTFVPTLSTDVMGVGRKNLKAESDATFAYVSLTPGAKFSLTHNLHEKVFIVDGEKAIIGGRNISDSSLRGKDMEVQMEGPVVNQVQDHYKKMFDFVTGLKIKSSCVREDIIDECIAKFKKTMFSLEDKKYFPDQKIYEDGVDARIISHEALIHQYKRGMNKQQRLLQEDDILDTVIKFDFKKLRAYNYFIIPTARWRSFLEKNLAAGNSIDMITNSLESAKFSSNWGYIYSIPDVIDLMKKGLEVYQWQRNQKLNYVHEKVLIFDDEHVIIGSHNFGTGSTGVSDEIVVEVKSRAIAARLTEVFDAEKMDPKITQKATLESLGAEESKYSRMIKYIRTKALSSFLFEIY
ncbi:MAG: phosphatidylserine/phosphatidylglycerophosphate/cardiolipin synthase family protein [Bacteriovorax sp.]|nr:phosphatidylserine/phosphatidylglycerophosphate/cardiolipin synthase family protein [Bacteriovorax sp.]